MKAITELDDDGVYSCLGFSGRGVPTATAVGAVLADLLEARSPGELSLPGERSQRVPPGLAWPQSTQMRWARIRDRLRMRFEGIDLLPPTI